MCRCATTDLKFEGGGRRVRTDVEEWEKITGESSKVNERKSSYFRRKHEAS